MIKTALNERHREAGAKLVDFHGVEMPLDYGSQIKEHEAVRASCGVFDVSHMNIVDVLGAGARTFLRHLLSNDVDKLSHPGKALYTCMLNNHGGIVDDLIVYYRSPDNYRLVLNSATKAKDLKWLHEQSAKFAAGLQEQLDYGILAVQGPKAIERLSECLDNAQVDALSTLQPFELAEIGDMLIARTGYTGEDGAEIMLPNKDALALWPKLLAAGITPCGLGARDTLRLEAGMMLYGQDMDETTTPLESGLGWTVAFAPEDRDFIGRGALSAQKMRGVDKKIVGLVLEDKGIMRSGQKVVVNGEVVGLVTSGSYSPTLKCSIALARVDKTLTGECEVEVRGKPLKAKITKPRFVKHGKSIL